MYWGCVRTAAPCRRFGNPAQWPLLCFKSESYRRPLASAQHHAKNPLPGRSAFLSNTCLKPGRARARLTAKGGQTPPALALTVWGGHLEGPEIAYPQGKSQRLPPGPLALRPVAAARRPQPQYHSIPTLISRPGIYKCPAQQVSTEWFIDI